MIAHGFPAEAGGGINSTRSFPELADRVATEAGWAALAYSSRGCGAVRWRLFADRGWMRDLQGAVAITCSESVPCDGMWILGFGTGGALAIEAGAADPSINGVAACCSTSRFRGLGP